MIVDLKVGVSPLSWTNDVLEDLGSGIELEACLAETKAAGYQGVELGRKFPRETGRLGPVLQKYELELVSGWYSGFLGEQGVKEELRDVKAHAELLRNLGSKVMVYGECGVMAKGNPFDQPINVSPSLDGIDAKAYADRMTEFSRFLIGEYGIRLAYHHHLMMLVEKPDEVERFYSETGDDVGVLLDTGHTVAAGGSLDGIIKRFGARICHIHLKDIRRDVLDTVINEKKSFNQGVRDGMFTIPGEGCVDFGPVADYVHDSGYSGWVVVEAEQDPTKAIPFPTVTKAREFVRKKFSI